MDLNERTIHDVVHPTAIFRTDEDDDGQPQAQTDQSSSQNLKPSWETSQLNPKNRIDSLEPPEPASWMIDGCTALGLQFYAIPLFLDTIPPTRCDIYIDEAATLSPLIRGLLNLDTVFHVRDRNRVQRQDISSYIIRALQYWTAKCGVNKVRDIYHNSPFGARIVFHDLPLNVRDVHITVVENHAFELRHLTVAELADTWQMSGNQLPPTLDILDLTFVRQLHDSVCIVRSKDNKPLEMRNSKDDESGSERNLWVLKALMNNIQYMYHELRVLLNMPPHPNIVARPTRLVVKKHKLNMRREIVVGFLMPFYSGGGFRDELPLLRVTNRLQLGDQLRWARDICSGLLHIHFEAKTYYPDLRLDQIVFPKGDRRPIILDFEQRGVWVEFGPPEVNAIEYIRILAFEEEQLDDDMGLGNSWPAYKQFVNTLDRLVPQWRNISFASSSYNNPPHGYNIPWISLSRREQEYAEVYMLGRLLWCIFEGMSAPQRAAVWQSYQNEPEYEFPEFKRTPPELRELILRCTRGYRSQLSSLIGRKQSKIVLRSNTGPGDGTEAEIRAAAKDFWLKEVMWAEEFVMDREKQMAAGKWDENIFGRPTLLEVASALEAAQKKLTSGTTY
ncbi:hypothetical protein BD289DRAFT_420805 [Coniella lustricola]|uniref:Protein kinase domain-containing protein n=1 Tax=Coniella lustricola TaxID=2025994 RepID=A0A2T3AMK2_9PEZI|nr:hypothetical protein BD289DRAFT_420805 [Coniella lustricola]